PMKGLKKRALRRAGERHTIRACRSKRIDGREGHRIGWSTREIENRTGRGISHIEPTVKHDWAHRAITEGRWRCTENRRGQHHRLLPCQLVCDGCGAKS